ncbi:MAG: hypothetical protein AAF480_13485 [Actinomycetota bacterium]
MAADPPQLTADDATAWFTSQVPDAWFSDIRVLVDRDEIMVVGTLITDGEDASSEDGAREERELGHIEWFREETRDARVKIASRAEAKFGRKVSWATGCGETQAAFTHLSVPVMTRLRIGERQILDTLVSAGVARSRSDALGWCVRLVSQHEGDWLAELRDAIAAVDRVRSQGPG